MSHLRLKKNMGVVSVNNSSNTPLGAGGVFTGTTDDMLHEAVAIVTVHPDQDSAVDGLSVEFSDDAAAWHVTDVFTIQGGSVKTFTFQPVMRYIRIVYTNGAVPQAHLHLSTQFRTTMVKPSSHRVEESISGVDDAELVKAVLTGESPDGSFSNAKLDNVGALNIAFGDTANLDGFQRLRVAEPVGVYDAHFEYGLANLRYNAITASGGTITHLPNESSASLATVAVAGSRARLISKACHRYIPGKSQMIAMTSVIGAGVAGVIKRVGYFDTGDGIFLEQNGVTDVAFVLRTSTSGAPSDANRVVQANWNRDTFDGTGPSAITLDLTKGQILMLDLQWLGMGRVRCGFDIDGRFWPAHEFRNANSVTAVYMKTANLPVQYEIVSAAGAVASMKATCSTVVSEGGSEKDQGFVFAAGTTVTAPRTVAAGTPLPVVAIRPALLFGGVQNRALFKLENVSWLAVSGAGEYKWEVIYNCAITGGAWGTVNADSTAEVNITGTAVAGGIVVAQGFDNAAAAARQFQSVLDREQRYPWCLDQAGNQITVALVFTEAGGNTEILASMQWRETR
jgi:hypothetical protein